MSTQQVEEKPSRKWWALVAACVGLFMGLLDVTIVVVALPSIQSELHTSISSLEWVTSSYILIFAVALVTSSRLGDIFGRKTVFIIGLFIFTIGSLLCALSSEWTIGSLSPILVLNISRGIQGLGASAMMPLSLAIISAAFTGKQRGMAIGIWGSVSGLGSAIGPLVGGILVDKINWQSIFYINIPIGIVGIVLSLWAIKQSRDETAEKRVDVFGLVTFTVFMFCLIFGLIRVNEANLGWSSPEILGLWGISALAIIIFIFGELKIKHPMVDPRLFKVHSFIGATVSGFCLYAGMYALFFYLSIYFQNFLGFSPLETGWRFLTFTVFGFILGPVVGVLMGKFGVKWLIVVPLGLLAVGVGLMAMISPQDKAADWLVVLPGFIVAGVGNGLIFPPISSLAMGTVERQRAGMASGINNVAKQMGTGFGTALFGAILANRYTTVITDKIHALNASGLTSDVKEKVIKGLSEAGPIAGSTGLSGMGHANVFQGNSLFPTIKEIARSSFVMGTRDVILTAATILAIGTIACVFLIRKGDMKH